MNPMPRKQPRRKRAGWHKEVTEAGITVRVYERSGTIYREVRVDGQRDRKSLGHADRALAQQQAKALATRLAELRLTGHVTHITLGALWGQYQLHRLPNLTPGRQGHVRQHAAFWLAHLGAGFAVEDFSQSHVDSFARARRDGTLRAANRANATRVTVRDDTIRQNVNWIRALFRFARLHRVGGRPLLATNPMEGLEVPREKNVRRPVATADRYRLTLQRCDAVEPSGRLAGVLSLARFTGRRINAILNLLPTDLLLSQEMVSQALAATGQDPEFARFMPNGAIRWRAETDKQGFESIAPLSRDARAALDAYLRRHPRIGDQPVFPAHVGGVTPWSKAMATYHLRRAEDAAGLPHLDRGGFHAYRRLWASERKHLPDVDVARAGGWRDLATMKESYQQPDPRTTLDAVENRLTAGAEADSAPDGHTTGTAEKRNAAGTTT